MSLNKLVVGIAAVCAFAGLSSASSSSIKAKHFDPASTGWIWNPGVDGMAMVKYDPAISGSRVHLHMEKLEHNCTYGVALQATSSFLIDFSDPSCLTTNPGGVANCDIALPGIDLGTSPLFYIYECDGNLDHDSVYDVTTDEIRAIGMVGEPTTATVKIKDFSSNSAENANVDGMAVISYNTLFAGSDVYLHLSDLVPNTTYGVALQGTLSTEPDYSRVDAFVTDAAGRGTFTVTLPAFDLGTTPTVFIYRWDGNTDPDSVLQVTSTELRATGTVGH